MLLAKKKKAALKNAKRFELQSIGDAIRKKDGLNRLAVIAAERAIKETEGITEDISFVFDSVRNTNEVKAMREKFPNFYLIAVDCPRDERWRRVRDKYERNGLTETNFDQDDSRDKGEDFAGGQEVELCVDEADVILLNDENYPEKASRLGKIEEKARLYLDLLSGTKLRTPDPDEFFMSLAYTASLNSKCFKRQVGAVIVDKQKNILSMGYNENLAPHKSCIEDPGDCHRDIYKRDYFGKLKGDQAVICPKCKNPLEYTPDFKCAKCGKKLDSYYIPDKALSRCQALHAEARALRALRGSQLRKGTVLYTTASPCLLCAVDIINAGIKDVVYSEAYTDQTAIAFLRKEGVDTKKFEGVKANAYFKTFGSWRRETENEIKEKVRKY